MWARLRYLVHQARFKNQQEILNGPVVCVPKKLVYTQYFARSATSGFIKDCQELKKHWRKKACLDTKSVKVNVSQLAVWISHK